MFQYAGYLGLTASCSQLCSVISSSEAQILTRIFNNLTAIIKTLNDVGFPKVELQNEERIFDEESLKKWNCSGNITSEDYFQSWRYFHPKLKDQLKAKDFKFNDNILQSVGQFLNDTLVNNNISDAQQTHLVGLHVRKFDPNSYGFLSGTDATFNEGIKRIRLNLKAKAIKAVVYIILSNDATWESKLLPKSPETLPYREILIFSDLNSAAADMALLTKMDSVIVCASGSTFGWWGAYLSSATVYYAKEYASPNSSLYWHTKPEDYFLPEWIPI